MKQPEFYLLLLFSMVLIACDKKYERPDRYSVDLFKNEKAQQQQQKKILTPEEALSKSMLVLKTDSLQLLGNPRIGSKSVYVYKISVGKILKNENCSVAFPVRIISDVDLLKKKKEADSAVVYLVKPTSYKLLIKDFGVSFQTLAASMTD